MPACDELSVSRLSVHIAFRARRKLLRQQPRVVRLLVGQPVGRSAFVEEAVAEKGRRRQDERRGPLRAGRGWCLPTVERQALGVARSPPSCRRPRNPSVTQAQSAPRTSARESCVGTRSSRKTPLSWAAVSGILRAGSWRFLANSEGQRGTSGDRRTGVGRRQKPSFRRHSENCLPRELLPR